MARSTDGGSTFTNTEVGRVFDDLDCYPINTTGSQTLSGEQFRISSFPSAALDPTTGRLAIVWADDQGAGRCGKGGTTFTGTTSNQVKLVTSADGLTFSSPRTITTGAADKVFPAGAANVGKVAVSYYTRAYSPDTTTCAADGMTTGSPVCLDVAARTSGDNFAGELRLTDASSNPFVEFRGTFIGDLHGHRARFGRDRARGLDRFPWQSQPGHRRPAQPCQPGRLHAGVHRPLALSGIKERRPGRRMRPSLLPDRASLGDAGLEPATFCV